MSYYVIPLAGEGTLSPEVQQTLTISPPAPQQKGK